MAAISDSNTTARRSKPILSIRARLVVIALLAVVPLMLDRVRLLEQSRNERIDIAAREALDLAKRGADQQSEILTTVRALSRIVARAYVVMLARGETCNMYLKDLTGSMPWLKGMSIVGADGRITCATLPSALGLDMSERPHYQEALRTRDFVLSKYLVGRATGTPAIIAAYPAQAVDPSVNAVVVASVDLQWLNTITSMLEKRPGSTVLLIDGDMTVLAGDADAAPFIGKSIADTYFANALDGRNEGSTRSKGLDGVDRIYAFVRVPGSEAFLAVGLDEADVLGRVDRDIQVAYVQLGIFGMLVFLIVWFGGERLIVDPIRSLTRTAIRIGRGDHSARPEREAWVAEFSPLAAALKDMARKLGERENELRAANRHLETLATMDSLTGLANRRGFDARLNADWQRAQKLRRPVALLMIDVDHFKQFNDRYGHVEGDVCLRRIGKLLTGAADRVDDLAARYGGEEFALLLPGAELDQAIEIAEQLRHTIEDLCIAHASSPCGQVTISVGVASLIPGVGADAERLVEAADAGLYAAKRRGRNAVVAYAPHVLKAAS